jgi:hypothetical protein
MSFDNDLLAAAAADLHTRVPTLAWQPDGVYPASVIGIYLVGFPQDGPASVALALYGVDPAQPADTATTVGLQVAFRTPAGGDPRIVNDLADDVFDAWHGLHGATFGPAPVRQMWQQSWASPVYDGRRWIRTDNYYLQTARPAPASTPT